MNYNILNAYEAEVNPVNNPYHFEQSELFKMALRNNKKRKFLFVSEILGKHLAVEPEIPLLTGHLLACQYSAKYAEAKSISSEMKSKANLKAFYLNSKAEKIKLAAPTVVIGFAETATALGHSFFEKLTGDVRYVHTTREHILELTPSIRFEEEHSHATSHLLYANSLLLTPNLKIILVDDEMTTGKTNINIINQLVHSYNHLKKITLVSILDFRNEQARASLRELAEKLKIEIDCVSMFTADLSITELNHSFERFEPQPEAASEDVLEIVDCSAKLKNSLIQYSVGKLINSKYYKYSGRFELSKSDEANIDEEVKLIGQHLKTLRSSGPTLVLGTGEFMFVPMAIASEMGDFVKYHTTTRSPIHANEQSYIHSRIEFSSPEIVDVQNYLYNIKQNEYEDIFVIFEHIVDQQALKSLNEQLKRYAKKIHIVTLGGTL